MNSQELINYLKEFNQDHNKEPELNLESADDLIQNA